MRRTARFKIQEACDDVYSDPDDATAAGRLRRLLGGSPTNGVATAAGGVVSPASWRRLVKIACDELHDDPFNAGARAALLKLIVDDSSDADAALTRALAENGAGIVGD